MEMCTSSLNIMHVYAFRVYFLFISVLIGYLSLFATIKTLKQHDEEKINTIILFFALGFGVVKAQDLPDKKETLKTVTKVNDYFMKKYADYRTPSFVKNVTRPSNIWTRGVYYEGLMALYSVYPRDDYYKYAVDWSNYHEWGFRNGTTTRNADDYWDGLHFLQKKEYDNRHTSS